jgi:hypothetical protein
MSTSIWPGAAVRCSEDGGGDGDGEKTGSSELEILDKSASATVVTPEMSTSMWPVAMDFFVRESRAIVEGPMAIVRYSYPSYLKKIQQLKKSSIKRGGSVHTEGFRMMRSREQW